jgi:hypothetical protein
VLVAASVPVTAASPSAPVETSFVPLLSPSYKRIRMELPEPIKIESLSLFQTLLPPHPAWDETTVLFPSPCHLNPHTVMWGEEEEDAYRGPFTTDDHQQEAPEPTAPTAADAAAYQLNYPFPSSDYLLEGLF